jgi:signal transduction histidine kinase
MMGRLPLAAKCLVLFGSAVLFIVIAAMVAPWLRMTALVDEGQLELSRQVMDAWLEAEAREKLSANTSVEPGAGRAAGPEEFRRIRLLADGSLPEDAGDFARDAMRAYADSPARLDVQRSSWLGTSIEYRYARFEREFAAGGQAKLAGLVVMVRPSRPAARLLVINTLYLLSAGSAVLGLALLTFYFITQKLVLNPVRALRETADRVREGNLEITPQLNTGDEFEELAETLNTLLADLRSNQDQLRSINFALDLKVNELAESNVALYEAAKLKGDFLASISHELRTPLNSILGFTELLTEIAKADLAAAEPGTPAAAAAGKRQRYLDNILTAGRNLLDLINTLLDMAKIEAGKVELRVEPTVLRDLCEALAGLIFPLAEKKGIAVRLELADDLPVINTDVKKLQQILFNFLSNAVKFSGPQERSGRQGLVILRAERLVAGGPEGQGGERVRVSVIDDGPGIPAEAQRRIFDKFYRLEQGHTREHSGTGLGLAICRELAAVLQGEIQVVSEVGRGSMFSLILPLSVEAGAAGALTEPGRLHAGVPAVPGVLGGRAAGGGGLGAGGVGEGRAG